MAVQTSADKQAPELRKIENAASRADDVRRRLSRLIVRSGAWRSDPVIVKRDGDVVVYRKPSHANLVEIGVLAARYAELAKALRPADDGLRFETIDALMRENGAWGGGRSRRILPTGEEPEKDDRLVDRSAGVGRDLDASRHRSLELDAEGAVTRDYLAGSGFHVEKAGATGQPPGRRHLTSEHRTRISLEEIAPLPDIHRAILASRHRSPEQNRLYRLVARRLKHRRISPRHAARSLTVSERTVKHMKKTADQGGDAEVFQVLEELLALRAEIADVKHTTAETHRIVLDTAERIRERFPSNEDVSAAVDLFIASVAA